MKLLATVKEAVAEVKVQDSEEKDAEARVGTPDSPRTTRYTPAMIHLRLAAVRHVREAADARRPEFGA